MTKQKKDYFDVEKNEKKIGWSIPIACGIFTFIYWFILTPLLWSAINHEHTFDSFGLYMLTMFMLWAVLVGLFMVLWCCRRRTDESAEDLMVKDRVSIVKKGSEDNRSDSPPYPTKAETVQPSPISYKAHCSLLALQTDSEKDVTTISLNSCPIQPQNTPSLYNAKTGRHSYETGYAEGSSVSVPNVVKDAPKHETGVKIMKKSDSVESNKAQRRISSSDSDTEMENNIKEPDPRKKSVEQDSNIIVETAIIEHNGHDRDTPDVSLKEGADEPDVPRLSSNDSFHGLPEMKDFDDYLHLTTVDTPMTPPTAESCPDSSRLTPRQMFFSDMMKQAEENERMPGTRRSYSIGDEIEQRDKPAIDKRKSMPLYYYFCKNMEVDPEVPTLMPPSDDKDFVSVADSEDYSLSSPTQKVTSDELQYNLERLENVIDPECADVDVAMEPPADEAGAVSTEPADHDKAQRDSGSQFFIANVVGSKSVTSEVYLNIGDDGAKPEPSSSIMHWEIVTDTTQHQDDDNDDYMSDDCVFEDDGVKKKDKK